MSYQPPTGGMPPLPPSPPTSPMQPMYSPLPPQSVPAAPPPVGARRMGLVWAGIGVAVGGIVAGAVLASMASSTKEETIQKFARAPVGCTTTLEFERAATFTLFVETKGSAIDVGGDCAGNGASYDRASSEPPQLTIDLVDEDDAPMELTEFDGFSYDTDQFRGQAVQQVTIESPGTYRLTVTSDETDFAVAIGGDPEADSATVMAIGLAVAVVGLLAGLAMVLLGLRRRPTPPTSAAPSGVPTVPAPGWAPQPPAYQYPPAAPPPPPQATPPAGPGWGAPQA
jgi:hypothetical protein